MKMEEMFADETTSPKGGESGMKAARELDVATDEALADASPVVTAKAATLKALVKALNGVTPLFGAPAIEIDIADLKGEPLPTAILKILQAVNAAYYDYADEDAVSFDSMKDDKGILIEIAKLSKILGDKGFVKFLKTSETKGTQDVEEAEEPEEPEEGDDEEMMMTRMGIA